MKNNDDIKTAATRFLNKRRAVKQQSAARDEFRDEFFRGMTTDDHLFIGATLWVRQDPEAARAIGSLTADDLAEIVRRSTKGELMEMTAAGREFAKREFEDALGLH